MEGRTLKTLIKNGTIVTDGDIFSADLLIDGEKIAEIGPGLSAPDARVVDAEGKLVFPGFVDAHTHFDLPVSGTVTADDFESGSECALLGGTTCVVDFATQDFGETLAQALKHWHEKADGKASCDYAFHMAISQWTPQVREEMADMVRQGIPSFKIYMTYGNQVSDEEIYEILTEAKALGALVCVHCENHGIIQARIKELMADGRTAPASHPLAHPDQSEAEAIHRLLTIAALVDVPVMVVHLTSKAGLKEIKKARKRGQTVYTETCPQYLLLEDSVYEKPRFEGAKFICSPPIRKKKDRKALWRGLERGDIQLVSTDHCTFTMAQKEVGKNDFSKIPGGVPGVEERVGLLLTCGVGDGCLSLPEAVELLSGNPARLYGLYPRKGSLQPGSDADVVLWDPTVRRVLRDESVHTKARYTAYRGMELQGAAETVFLRGEVVVDHGELVNAHRGVFVPRKAGNL